MDPDRARERLADERTRVEQELERIGRPEAADQPQDSGDQADELQQEGTDDALREDLNQTLEAIERAEARAEGGDLRQVSGERRSNPGRASRGSPLGRPKGRRGARRARLGLSRADQQVVEELWRQPRLQDAGCPGAAGPCSSETRTISSPQGTSSGTALASNVRTVQPWIGGQQLLPADSDPPNSPAAVAKRTQITGGERVNVDLGLEVVAVLLRSRPRSRGADAPASRLQSGAVQQRGPLGDRREKIAVARGLAAEDQRAAGPQDPGELRERLAQVGDVMEDGVPEDEVEALVARRAASRPRPRRSATSRPSRAAFSFERDQHPGRDVGGRGALDRARAAAG